MKRLLITITLACVLSSTALAGDMPGVNHASAIGEVPTVGSTGGVPVAPASVTGDMPGVNPTCNETGLVTTVLLTIITLLGR